MSPRVASLAQKPDSAYPNFMAMDRLAVLIPLVMLAGCASSPSQPEGESHQEEEVVALRAEMARLTEKVEKLEQQITNAKPQTEAPPIITQKIRAPIAPTSPQPDGAVRSYRQAMILFRNREYPESVLAFSAFLERHPDHTLSGNAQYYIGEAYYLQGENRLAEKEFERVKSAYFHSPMISFALARLAQVQEALQQEETARSNREMLQRTFPDSPALHLIARRESEPAPGDLDLIEQEQDH